MVFDWDDSGVGDDTTGHSHIGCVEFVNGNTIGTIEGNSTNSSCVRHNRTVGQRYIRGFITPNYSEYSDPEDPYIPDDPEETEYVEYSTPFDPNEPYTLHTWNEIKSIVAEELTLKNIITDTSVVDVATDSSTESLWRSSEFYNANSRMIVAIVENKINKAKTPLVFLTNNLDDISFTLEGIAVGTTKGYVRVTVDFDSPSIYLDLTEATLSARLGDYVISPGVFYYKGYVDNNRPYDGTGDIGDIDISLPYRSHQLEDSFMLVLYRDGGWDFPTSSRPNGFYDGMTAEDAADGNNYRISSFTAINVAYNQPGPGPGPGPIPEDPMTLQLWKNFNKRKNSTKRPNILGETLEVRFIEDTSIINPHFILNRVDFTYNYCLFQGRYYYIDNIVSLNNNHIRLECSIDYLATWKTEIMASNAYVLRAATGYNENVGDPMVVKTNNLRNLAKQEFTLTHLFDSTGCYCVGIKNRLGGEGGMLSYYFMTTSILEKFSTFVNLTLLQTDSTALIDKLKKLFASPDDVIVSCIWLPFSILSIDTVVGTQHRLSDEQIYIADIPITYNGAPLNAYRLVESSVFKFNGSVDLNLPYTDFRRTSEFIDCNVFLPFYGLVPLNVSKFPETIYLDFSVDLVNGGCVCHIRGSFIDTLTYIYDVDCITYNIATEIAIATTGTNTKAAASLGATFGGMAAYMANPGGSAAADLLAGAAAVVGSVNASMNINHPPMNVVGVNASKAMSDRTKPFIEVTYFETLPLDYTNIMGRSVMEVRSLNHAGFVQTANAQINMAGTQQEKETVNGLLDAGVYIE